MRRPLEGAVVVDFPMFEYDEEAKRWSAMAPSFHRAKDGHEDRLAGDPGAALAKAYDMVLNGSEIGGGSVRFIARKSVEGIARSQSARRRRAEVRNSCWTRCSTARPPTAHRLRLDRIVAMMAGTSRSAT